MSQSTSEAVQVWFSFIVKMFV